MIIFECKSFRIEYKSSAYIQKWLLLLGLFLLLLPFVDNLAKSIGWSVILLYYVNMIKE